MCKCKDCDSGCDSERDEEVKTYVLVIWNLIPEDIKFYLIPDDEISPKFNKQLIEAHHSYINGDDWNKNTGLLALQSFLFDEEYNTRHPELEIRLEKGKPIDLVERNAFVRMVVNSGFIL